MLFSFLVYTLHLGIYALFISGIHFAFGYICSFHFWYTLCIWVYMLFSFLVYTLHLDIIVLFSFLVYTFHLGILFSFWYTLFIWVCSFHLGMHFAFEYACSFILVYTLHLGICSFHLGIHFSFGYANTLQRATQLCLHRTTPSEHDFLNNAHPSGRAKRSQQSVPFSIFLL